MFESLMSTKSVREYTFLSPTLFLNRCDFDCFSFASEIFLQSFLRHRVMGAVVDDRPIFFFDIDNCLYPRSRRVHDLMQRLINVCISHSFISRTSLTSLGILHQASVSYSRRCIDAAPAILQGLRPSH